MPSTRRSGVDSVLPKVSAPVRSSNTAMSVKVPPISAARRIGGWDFAGDDRDGRAIGYLVIFSRSQSSFDAILARIAGRNGMCRHRTAVFAHPRPVEKTLRAR